MAIDQPTASPASSFLSPHSVNLRRQSLPSRAKSAPGHASASRGNVQPASPEVISSLISSLSAISTPAQSHFDNLPYIGSRTAPSSPSSQTEFSNEAKDKHLGQHGFGMDYGAYKPADGGAESSFLHPDDAAIAPVVRMAKAPSSPKGPSSPRSRTSFIGTGGGDSPLRSSSRASHTSSKLGQEDQAGIGAISAEPGPRRSTASIASSNSGGRKSLKGQLGLLKRGSREFLKDKDPPHNGGHSLMINGSKSRASLRSTHSLHSMGELAEEEGLRPDTSDSPKEDPQTFTSSNPNPPKPNTDTVNTSSGVIGGGRVIPNRESSLRHAYSGSSKKRRSARHSRYSSIGELKIDEVSADEEKVNKRIRELKEQQKKIKDELVDSETTQAPDNRNSTSSNTIQNLPPEFSNRRLSYQSSRVADESPTTNLVLSEEADDSAPSPTIMTRRSTTRNRASGPLSPKPINIPPGTSVKDADKFNQSEQALRRRYSIAITPSAENSRRVSANGTFSSPGRVSSAEDRPSSTDSLDEAVEAYTASPRLTQKITHPHTGRVIAFSEVGDPEGYVVFCCVGMGLTRYLTAFYDELAWTLKLRLITPDRPGVGESDPFVDGSGTPLSWPGKIPTFSLCILAYLITNILILHTFRRCCNHLQYPQDQQIFHACTLCRCYLCSGYCVEDASAYERPSSLAGPMDTSIPDVWHGPS